MRKSLFLGAFICILLSSLAAQQMSDQQFARKQLSAVNMEVSMTGIGANNGEIYLFSVSESDEGQDLNGDGDQDDHILHQYDKLNGVVNLLYALQHDGTIVTNGDIFVLLVSEQNHLMTDLNGDGDASDNVVHYFKRDTGAVINVGLAVRNKNFLSSNNSIKVTSTGKIAMIVSESAQGGTDRNNDSDTNDYVLAVHDTKTNSTRNLKMAQDIADIFTPGPEFIEADGDIVVSHVNEKAQGNTDFNSDGDVKDNFLLVFNAQTGVTQIIRVNLKISNTESFSVKHNTVVFRDWLDTIHILNLVTGNIVNLQLVSRNEILLEEEGRKIFFSAEESTALGDYNFDGDFNDNVVHKYDIPSGNLMNYAVAAHVRDYENGVLIYHVLENFHFGVDINGDGDAIDAVLVAIDEATGAAIFSGAAVAGSCIESGKIFFYLSESQHFSLDLNGDGDANDWVLVIFDLATSQVLNSQLAVPETKCVFDSGFLYFRVFELQQGKDLNGDGDTSDIVCHFYNEKTKGFKSLNLAGEYRDPKNKLVPISVAEWSEGKDLNGDGDTNDLVLHVVK